MSDVDIVAIMRDMAEGRRNSCGDKWASSWCKDAANEIERLRAELAERDKAEGLCPTCVDTIGPELARKCPAKPPAHPPRQAVPDASTIVTALMEAWASSEPDSPITRYPQSYVATFADMAKAVRAMLTAAPEARSEAEIQAEALTQESMYLGRLADQALAERNLTEGGLFHREAQRMLDKAARLREGEK